MELWDLETRRGAGGGARIDALLLLLLRSLLLFSGEGCFDRLLLPASLSSPPVLAAGIIPRRTFSVAFACLQHKKQHQQERLGGLVGDGYIVILP